jgi:hypothetical protein
MEGEGEGVEDVGEGRKTSESLKSGEVLRWAPIEGGGEGEENEVCMSLL